MSDLSFQVRAPLGLELVTGDVVTVDAWSLSGLEFPGDSDVLPSQGQLSIPFQGVDIRFPVKFRRGDGPRALLFDGLSGRQRETLAVFYRSILSGRMASTEEVITSLDTPVDLVPMGETEEEQTEAVRGTTPRALRAVWNVLFYGVIGLLVFGVLGQQIWARLSSIDVGQARVVAELVVHPAPTGAYVDEIRVKPGDRVRQGQTLVVLSSPGHKAVLTDIRADLRLAEARASRTRAALALHAEGKADARRPLEEALARAIAARRPADFLGGYDLRAVRQALHGLQMFDAGVSQAPDDFHGQHAYLMETLRDQKSEIAALKRALSAEKSIAGAADIVAMADGVVNEMAIFEDQFLSRGDVAVTVEAEGPRHVVGWLDEAMAAAVYPGMGARMVAISGGQTRQIRGTVQEVVAMAHPDRGGAFGLRVLVLPADWVASEAPELLRPGAPMDLSLDRNLPWVTALQDLFDVRP
ncbi:hypothetical protein Dshi_1899 [Dinoroseobacter shibae DFL 12 = DSM 16493]|uniref:Uncharacterized protein n=1 Tax=Dinoroseobacter shibae (strain DSM 16493 / NCIMB 14021 / DFL 12) TaxID=398580 RepID=A8LNC8_DINSH|nr:HlyD family secretion protein [Dinoroseobacter shibae]ABV93641.1 hypothetical protein Dshi_1899 [Dinoroseobacter shibae DFL 12 = DSM 16493]URF45091.1 HlyD family efflux transporter periplasmic adaptor subunit [Dinoroseobacter shibae]URF49396.1 HlyD family efflux transporter periplasmic adaptor subunit [Dinoroseobacter shibae]